MARKSNTQRIALLSLFVALGVVFLYLGSLIEILDLTAAVLASFICVVAVIECGGASPWLVWGATSLLSLILLPQKLPAFMYAVFFGFYPIIKEKLEKHLKSLISWVIKVVIFNIAIFATVAASRWLFVSESSPVALDIAFIVLAEVTLVLYDIAMTRVISLYIFKLRKRFKIK